MQIRRCQAPAKARALRVRPTHGQTSSCTTRRNTAVAKPDTTVSQKMASPANQLEALKQMSVVVADTGALCRCAGSLCSFVSG
jgi:hypothetical protein